MPRPKREDIQGLRAIAIIMVLLFHFFPGHFPNGYVGVDMFFVISGYIISMVFPKEITYKNILEFYYRRVKRILPLYFFTIFVVVMATLFLAPQSFADFNMESGRRSVLLISNIVSAGSVELDYQRLLDNEEDLFTHCWSLCLEMQWYLLAPIGFVFKSARVRFGKVILVISALHYVTVDKRTAFNCVFARLWQFMSGILAHECAGNMPTGGKEPIQDANLLLVNSYSKSENNISVILSQLFALSLLMGFIPVEYNSTLLRGLMTVSTAALLLSGAVIEASFLKHHVLSWIGNISYALYLVHWPVYITAEQNGLNVFIGLVISVILATLIYYLFEQKYLKWDKRTILFFVVGLFTSTLFLAFNGMEIRRRICSEFDAQQMAAFNNPEKPSLAINIAEGALMNNTNNIYSSLCKYDRMFGIRSNAPYGHCSMPNGNGSYNMLVLGNSFATNQGEMVYRAFSKFAKKFDIYSYPGCEPMVQSKLSWCPTVGNYGRGAVKYFKPDVLFVLFRALASTPEITVDSIDDDPIFNEMLENLRFYEQFAKKIYIQQALPWCSKCTTAPVMAMIAEGKNLTEIGERFIVREERYARTRIAELAERCKNCELIDFLPYLPSGADGKPHFYDLENNLILLDDFAHLNKFGKNRIQPAFDKLANKFQEERLVTSTCN